MTSGFIISLIRAAICSAGVGAFFRQAFLRRQPASAVASVSGSVAAAATRRAGGGCGLGDRLSVDRLAVRGGVIGAGAIAAS